MDLLEADEQPSPINIPTEEELSEFKSQVAEWVKIDDQIKKLRVAIRERVVHQKALGSRIQNFMKTYKYDNLNTAQGRIHNKCREVKQPLKVKDIKDKVYNIVEQDDLGFNEEIIQRIRCIFEGDRPVTVKETLQRQVPKVSLSLDL